ncbi:unnamed protein product [Caenorhabditis bovis]|uniref:beta-mannosidase n=1 Tax=Caenorhabditis bovis TaxID=2654633 RepID=A0A8S1E9G7_9PELO|nr:unnamed protein product [Caenorhabditis bovis]
MWTLLLIFACYPFVHALQETFIDLTGRWNFTSIKGYNGTAIVPGDLFHDLWINGFIKDPLYGNNYFALKNVTENNEFTYFREFSIETVHPKEEYVLSIGGLDTYAVVSLNGNRIVASYNQFLSHLVNITGRIHDGTNVLSITFKNTVAYAKDGARRFKAKTGLSVPPECPPALINGECHVNFVRKAQYSFGWDWAPSMPTVGISKDIFIVRYLQNYLEDFTFQTFRTEMDWLVEVEFRVLHYTDGRFQLYVEIPELGVYEKMSYDFVSAGEITRTFVKHKFYIDSEKVQLWWPVGYGPQKLYDIRARAGTHTKTKKIGFRSVELDESFVDEKDSEKGRNFFFKVNDIPIFLKGTNWVPVSMFPYHKENEERVEFLLDSVVEAGMNTIRVWGGGFYESEHFYEYATKKGLLIWQDFMFACSLYPNEELFKQTTDKEVRLQTLRLAKYPSILTFSTNNEIEVGIRQNWFKSDNYTMEQQSEDYVTMFKNIRDIIEYNSHEIPIQYSSPSNGRKTYDDGGVSENPQDPKYGDIHFYDDLKNHWKDNTFKTPRCASEYGVQSYPLESTMLKHIDKSDWSYVSDTMFYRQHHTGGIATNLYMIFSHLPIPKQCKSYDLNSLSECDYIISPNFMSRLAYYSQVHQAIALKTQTMHYRKYRNTTNESGEGNTMCAMYWQLNDVWAAPSWSSIDTDLKWKMAHYEAKRFFSEVAGYSHLDEKSHDLKIHVINDKNEAIKDVKVDVKLFAWTNEFTPIYESTFDLEHLSAGSVHMMSMKDVMLDNSLSDYVLETRVHNDDGDVSHVDYMIPDKLFEVDFEFLGDVKITDVHKINSHQVKLTVETDKPSLFTWIEFDLDIPHWFSDNGFHMMSFSRSITLYTFRPIDSDVSTNNFSICNLKSCFN